MSEMWRELRELQLMVREMVGVFKRQQGLVSSELSRLRQENEALRVFVKTNAVTRTSIAEVVEEKFKQAQLKMLSDFAMWQKSLSGELEAASLHKELRALNERVYRLEENLIGTPRTEFKENERRKKLAQLLEKQITFAKDRASIFNENSPYQPGKLHLKINK